MVADLDGSFAAAVDGRAFELISPVPPFARRPDARLPPASARLAGNTAQSAPRSLWYLQGSHRHSKAVYWGDYFGLVVRLSVRQLPRDPTPLTIADN